MTSHLVTYEPDEDLEPARAVFSYLFSSLELESVLATGYQIAGSASQLGMMCLAQQGLTAEELLGRFFVEGIEVAEDREYTSCLESAL